jgi:probable HAF family extracellular repeat protein/T5SS/PEP-CTERM-associated repeat protein
MVPMMALLVCLSAAQPGPSALATASGQSGSHANRSQSAYSVIDLGTLGGATTKAMGINEAGQIVGASQSGSQMFAFLWADSTMMNLGDLSGRGSWAYDINDAGQAIGGSTVDDESHSHAFRWQHGAMQDLGTMGGPSSYAFEINDSGQVVGYACCAPETYLSHAVMWGSGGIVDLGDLDPVWPAISAAYGINDAGQVVGGSYDASANFHAFLWQNGGMQDLGTLGGDYSSAEAINENGHVVGTARLANGTPHAFLWDGTMQDLGALTWDQSVAYDINDREQVVGALQTGPTSHAFIWANGQMQDLNNMIPANAGWVLQEARAINDKGQIVGFGTINGQTRAFLLKPEAYHWANPSGGSWHVSTNWDPQGIPGAGDVAVFDLSGGYSVDVTTVALARRSFALDRMVVSSSNIVTFNNMDLNLVYDSPEEPSLEVNDGATAQIYSGAATFSHAIIGGKVPGNPANAPTARLQVVGNGNSLTGTGRLTIGDEGRGEVFVVAGGHLASAETRLGGLLPEAYGGAEVSGDGSYWSTGNIAVGYGDSSSLVIRGGARVDSDDAFISYGIPSEDSQVIVDGAGLSQSSRWALQGSLTIGQTAFGSVEVIDGGDLYVHQDVSVKDGELRVDGTLPNGSPSRFDVLGSVFVGGPGNANLLALWNGATGGIEGNLILGMDGEGAAILWGHAHVATPTQLDVVDPMAGFCAIGRVFDGGISLDEGGLLRCRNIELGGRPGMNGKGELTVDGGMVRALEVLTVGFDGGGRGLLTMSDSALVATNGTYIATPNDTIMGTGTLAVGFLGLQNDGVLAPGITVSYPKAPAATAPAAGPARDETATMFIDGTLSMGATGRLAIPVTGSDPGQYGRLAVSQAANLGGVLELDFRAGFAPRQGDAFTFLTATEGLSGSFSNVVISGLAPDFEYELATVNGQITLTALSDGTPPSGERPLRVASARPNPFRASADIPFTLAQASHVRVKVFNVAGAAVRTLFDDLLPAGSHVASWDGRDASGRIVSSGVYFCVIDGGGDRVARKLLTLR